MFALVHHLGNTVTQEISTGEHTNIENSLPLGISPYLLSLPMSDRDRAHAILRSSAWACGIASAIILVSFAVIVGLSWGLGADLFHGKPEKLGTLIPWFMVVVWSGSLLLSFVFATLVCTLDFQKWSLRDWIAPIILIASLLASLSPISLPLSMAICAITIGYLVYATVRAMLREDISWVGVSLVWLVGVTCFTVLVLGLPESFGTHGLLLGSTLLLLAMLPFFTMASAIRQLRTT
jgi:MFS family permease